MNSIFSSDRERSPESSSSGELPVPDEVRGNFGLLLDWYTPVIFFCWIILGINVLVFVGMLLSGFDPDKATAPVLLKWGVDYGPATISRGEWWRVLTSTFVHLGFTHVLFNMAVLAQIGPFMERILGSVAFLIVYLASGVAGALCSLAWNPYLFSAGASGAIFGLYGALIGFLVLRRDSVPTTELLNLLKGAVVFLIYNSVFGILHAGTDIAAHAGGFLGGLVCGLVISNPIDASFRRRRLVRATLLGLAGVPAMFAVGAILPRPMDFVKELNEFTSVEKRVRASYGSILLKATQGQLKDREVAEQVRKQVLAPWEAERRSLSGFRGLPTRQQDFLTALLRYMDAQQQAWTELAQGFERQQNGLIRQSFQDQQAAERTLAEFIQTQK